MKPNRQLDFNEKPYIVIWETTQACDLACVHCRACAQPSRDPFELSTAEAKGLIDQIAQMQVPVFVLTGGDPLKRPDIYELVEYAHRGGVHTSMTPSATPLLTRESIARLKERGLARLAVSLDGSTAEIHDAFRRVPGSYQWTLNAIRWAREIGLPVQINTTITRRNLSDFDSMVRLLETLDIVLWSVFFLVPTGRGQTADLITAEEFEMVFEKLYETADHVRFDIKTTEAQHYRRFLLQRRSEERKQGIASERTSVPAAQAFPAALGGDGIARAPRGLNDAKGFVFVSHIGEVFPSGFLPLAAGNIRRERLSDLYRDAPLFRKLRDTSQLKGKCGLCEFKEICGGSRARAYALTGDAMAEEPCCTYQPKTVAEQRSTPQSCQRTHNPWEVRDLRIGGRNDDENCMQAGRRQQDADPVAPVGSSRIESMHPYSHQTAATARVVATRHGSELHDIGEVSGSADCSRVDEG